MKTRPATEQDLRQFFNGQVPATMRAIVVEHEGRLLGVAGVARCDDHLQAFSRITDELRPHKITIGKAAAKLRQMIGESIVWAVCDPNEPTSPTLLEWMGFRHVSEGVWRRG